MTEKTPNAMELVCPAGSLPALRAAIDNGADSVYLGFRDATNARNFPGLNFDRRNAEKALGHAHAKGRKVLLALNTYPQSDGWRAWTDAVDQAADLGVDALILADIGLLDYAARRHPDLALHLSVQASATTHPAIAYYRQRFNIRRVVLPRVLSLSQVRRVVDMCGVEVEVFGFGSLCVMVEGRCLLSSYATGESPNTKGACSPAHAVRWEEKGDTRDSRLGGVLIDRCGPGENVGYPVVCKGRFHVAGETGYAIEEPASLSTLDILGQLQAAGVRAIKIEGRQRGPSYIAEVTRIMRLAIDRCAADPQGYAPRNAWVRELDHLAEGSTHTLGALDRKWQ